MSRLVGYGLGEIADRLTILSLKLLYGLAAGKPTAHFAQEYDALFEQFWARGPYAAGVFDQTLHLAAVNAALWQAEDEMRVFAQCIFTLSEERVEEVADLGLRIQKLNDQRAALVAQINTLAGDTAGPEKL